MASAEALEIKERGRVNKKNEAHLRPDKSGLRRVKAEREGFEPTLETLINKGIQHFKVF
ncbi:MAG: hypothetical protein ISS17_00565 [Bacteroidales bacterium]|nr:hypothetical protein [Bacteroidales bacterium]